MWCLHILGGPQNPPGFFGQVWILLTVPASWKLPSISWKQDE